ncbi:MAG TPA: type 1 glutamine amidotransferase [Burkholderiales bacterium]|jgi:GMP synthase-like glutamine amidotransferase|nr:type 1 glutamine amidotransferase [Burkholderiales bacterium]
MKPIAIFRHTRTEGPGYFANYLDARNLPWRLIAVDEGAAVPDNPSSFGGLVFMGGPMSVNDDLPWIAPALRLIRKAVVDNVPVLGHCLGGQLMAKALGATVGRNPVKEIGWGQVEVSIGPEAHRWLGEVSAFEAFHWHGERFSIPPGAVRILGNRWCENQAFVLGPHLAMQCHVEMTADLVHSWLRSGAEEIAQSSHSPAVQSPDQITRELEARLAALHRVADRLYEIWTGGLKR